MKDEYMKIECKPTDKGHDGVVDVLVWGGCHALNAGRCMAMIEGVLRFLYGQSGDIFIEALENFMEKTLRGHRYEHDKMDDM